MDVRNLALAVLYWGTIAGAVLCWGAVLYFAFGLDA
jgi:hypothetical protein